MEPVEEEQTIEEPVEESVPDSEPEPSPDPASGPTAQGMSPDAALDVMDGKDEPSGDGFTERSVTVMAMTMNQGFTANGVPGVPGDELAYAEGHWFVIKKHVEEAPAEEQAEG